MVGRHIGSDLVLTLLNGAGKPTDTDNGMESKGAIQGGKRGEGTKFTMSKRFEKHFTKDKLANKHTKMMSNVDSRYKN